MLVRPNAFQVQFVDTVSQRTTIKRSETFLEPFHLDFPLALGHQWTGTYDENGPDIPSGL